MTLESYQPGSYTNALYTGDFPTLANDEEVSRMVELYRRDAGSKLPPGEPPPAAALSPTPPPAAEPVTDPEIYPTPIPAEGEDYGGGGDTDFGGRGRPTPTRPSVKPEKPPPEPYPEGDWKATAPPPPNGGRWVGEEISHTPTVAEAEDPSTWQEIKGGAARGVTGIGKNLGHVAGYVSKQLGNMTDSEVLKQFGSSVDGFVDGLDQQARGIVPERTMGEAWEKGYGAFANWTLGKTLEGGVGMLPPLAIARYAGLPAVLAYGAATSAVEEARREGSTNASVLAAAGEGAVMMGLPLKVMKMTEGQALLKRIATQAMAFAGIGAADPFVKAAVPAVAGEGYKTPTAGQVGEGAYLGGVLGAALAPVSGAKAPPVKVEPPPVKTGEVPPPAAPPPPAAAPPPPPAAPPGRSRIQDTYGNEPPPETPTPVYAPPRSKIQERYGTEPPPEGAAPTGAGPKGSPETAPPVVSGDPAATAAIDAAVNPQGVVYPPPRTPRPPAPVEEPPVAPPAATGFTMRDEPLATSGAARPSEVPGAGFTMRNAGGAEPMATDVRPTELRGAATPRETTTDITQPAAADALKAAEAAGYKLEPDHLDPNRQVAKNPAGEVIGKGGTAQETIADAVQRKGAPYVEEAAPTPARPTGERVELPPIPEEVLAAARPRAPAGEPVAATEARVKSKAKTEEFTPEVRAKASRSWGDLARDDAANGEYNPPSNSDRARTEYQYNWEQAAGDAAWKERLSGEKATAKEEAAKAEAAAEKAAATPGLRRKAQPTATEEAIAKSKAQTETKTSAPKSGVKGSRANTPEESGRNDAQAGIYKPPVGIPSRRTGYDYGWAARLREQGLTNEQIEAAKTDPTKLPAAEQTGKPTTVVKRPTKRVEVVVGKRGEAAVAEESTAQTEAADAAQAAQQRRLAERRAEKLPPKAQEARRTSLMASEAGRDIKDVQEAPATSKVTRGTPIEEVGEGMQIEHTAESIAETRSKTTTDTSLKYNDLLHDVIQGNKDLDTASKEAGSKAPGTRGRPRKNEDMATYLEREVIPRAERYNRADAAYMRRITPILENRKLTTKQRDKLLERVHESIQKRAKGRGRGEQERENLEDIKRYRDELRGVEKKGVDAPLYRDPDVEHGIKAAKRMLDLSINQKLQDRVKHSEDTGTLDSAHDYLNEIIKNHGAKIAAPDMVEYARHLLRLIPDHVQIGSYKALFKRAGMSDEQAAAAAAEKQKSAAGTYYPDASGIGLHSRARGHLENTLHEITHGVTYDYLDHLYRKQQRGESLTQREQKHVDALDAMIKEVTDLRDTAAISEREYNELDYAVRAAIGEGTGSERTVGGRHELVSQIMSNPYVREVLGRTPTSYEFKQAMKKLGYGEPATVWQAFKAFVKDIVGFKKGSVLDKVLDPLTDILETSSAHRKALDMGVELNAPLRGSGETSGRRWKPGDVPTDGLPSEWVRDKMRPFGEAFVDSPLFSKEGIKERLSEGGWKRGLASVGAKGGLLSSPTHKLAEFNQDVLPAGPQVMTARARIERAASEYRDKWGDRVQGWARQLKYGRDVGGLMNDATLNETYLTDQPTMFAQRNAHLTADQMKVVDGSPGQPGLRERFNNLSPEDKKLYSDVRDYYRSTHDEQRRLEYEDVLKRYMPDITQSQAEALGEKMKTKAGIKEVMNDPDVLSQAFGERWENSRALVRDIARLQDAGFVQGDYFPLRRYGDYVVRYGEAGTKHFGMEQFERSSDADARRIELQKEFAELAKTDKTAEGVRVSDVLNKRAIPNRREFMPENAFADMERAMVKRGSTPEQIEQAKEAYTYAMLRRQVSGAQAGSRMRRTGVQGASKDAARNLVEHYHSTSSLFGHLTHGAAETEAMRQARQQADNIEKVTGTPGTKVEIERSKKQLDALEARFNAKDPAVSKADLDHARQQHQWLEKPPTSVQAMRARETFNELQARRAPIDGDDSSRALGKAAGAFTGVSWAYHLARPAHLAIQVADAHANAQSFLGAAYGHGRAAASIVKAMKDLGPSGIGRGFKNAVKAVTGEMQHSDWHVGDMLTQKLINLKPGDAAHEQAMRGLMDLAKDYGIVDHTQSREVQRMSRQGGFDFGDPTGGKHPWTNIASNMANLFAVGEHTVDSTMRASILKAGYDLARSHGADVETAQREAVRHAMDAMPVWGAWNKPRITTPRGPIAKELVPAMMQYKQYGFHMYSVMGGLVRKAMFRPEERGEALKAMAGLVASHSILAGVTANMMALPVVAMLGAWDLFSGKEKPHDYETDLKRAITDMGGETVGKFAAGGLAGLAGANQSRSLKLTNMTDVPNIPSFDKAGAAQFMFQGITGASGDVAGQLFEGMHELFSGNFGRAAKMLAPRVISDPIKAYQLGQEGVTDKRGRTITPASQVTLGQQALQATGFNPYEPSLARQKRHAIEEFKGEYEYARQKAVDRYVLSGGKDMSGVRSYMSNDENRRNSPITYQQLRERMKEERKRETRPQFYGAMPSKKQERSFREATRFY